MLDSFCLVIYIYMYIYVCYCLLMVVVDHFLSDHPKTRKINPIPITFIENWYTRLLQVKMILYLISKYWSKLVWIRCLWKYIFHKDSVRGTICCWAMASWLLMTCPSSWISSKTNASLSMESASSDIIVLYASFQKDPVGWELAVWVIRYRMTSVSQLHRYIRVLNYCWACLHIRSVVCVCAHARACVG